MKRSIPFIAAGVMSLAFVSSAFAQGHGPEAGGFQSIARLCATDQQWTTDRMGERLAQRLNLTDQQKPALKALQDAIARAKGDAKAALCATTPDLSTLPARMAFAQKRLQARLDGMKAVQPKLEALSSKSSSTSYGTTMACAVNAAARVSDIGTAEANGECGMAAAEVSAGVKISTTRRRK
ncbi:MAG: Spy/CpxP family protein refolding chaperone, partial [Hyphomicrobiales bacterium]|nr:Spy/CpxP family protein refolding chaperone [Hyphomicrobiales bacterium]